VSPTVGTADRVLRLCGTGTLGSHPQRRRPMSDDDRALSDAVRAENAAASCWRACWLAASGPAGPDPTQTAPVPPDPER